MPQHLDDDAVERSDERRPSAPSRGRRARRLGLVERRFRGDRGGLVGLGLAPPRTTPCDKSFSVRVATLRLFSASAAALLSAASAADERVVQRGGIDPREGPAFGNRAPRDAPGLPR
jgi:hypothetical protein